MQYTLTEEQELLRETVRRLAKERVEPGARERDEKGKFDWGMVALFRENDLWPQGWAANWPPCSSAAAPLGWLKNRSPWEWMLSTK